MIFLYFINSIKFKETQETKDCKFGSSVEPFQTVGGKSAILTALCVAFGSRARGTQRANAMKDFIKTGCRYVG